MHTFVVTDPNPAAWAAMRDYVVSSGDLAVAQYDTTPISIPTSQWVQRVSPLWYWESSINDAEAAVAMAGAINGITALGRRVAVDEVRLGPEDLTSLCAYVVPLLDNPELVHWYLVAGTGVSYEILDWDFANPVITTILERGSHLLPEIYVSQFEAERSGDPVSYIDNYFRGPMDTKLPYLLDTIQWVDADPSQVRFVFPVVDRYTRDRNGKRRAKLPYAKHLDLVMSRAWRVYPKIAANGFGTWKWQASALRSSGRAATVAAMLKHYTTGPGATSRGKVKFFDK
mgnify:CR=1 FL=1